MIKEKVIAQPKIQELLCHCMYSIFFYQSLLMPFICKHFKLIKSNIHDIAWQITLSRELFLEICTLSVILDQYSYSH